MRCRPKHPQFKSPIGVPLNYLINSSSRWSRVSVVYSLRMGLKGLALVRFHVIKKFKHMVALTTNVQTVLFFPRIIKFTAVFEFN